MGRWWPSRREVQAELTRLTAKPRDRGPTLEDTRDTLTAAATQVSGATGGRPITPRFEGWQREAWDFYDALGEFRFAVTWKSNMISRVRLRAAKVMPGQDEPEIQDSGAPVEYVMELGGGVGGQADMLGAFSTYLDVPGEGFLVGETVQGRNRWQARSTDEVRNQSRRWQVIDEHSVSSPVQWRDLGPDSMVVRVWRPHKRYRHLADSPARGARGTMRELELVNRHIQAQYLSRLASAGVLPLPEEVTFPVRAEFQDEPDPFVREWVEVAAEAIATPGAPAAIVPIPLRIPGEYLGKIGVIDFTLKIDEKILEKRESAIKRLATQLDMPAEILLGLGDVNHWSAWQLQEDAVKAHIAPEVEIICHALTEGYLWPRLQADGVPDFDQWVVWYDASEITQRPDRSENAVQVYDRMELSGEALRRETGFDESDRPEDDEFEDMIRRFAAHQPALAMGVLAELTGETPVVSGPGGDVGAPEEDEDVDTDATGPPDTREQPPPPPDQDARRAAAIKQSKLMHALRFGIEGGDGFQLLHPTDCRDHLFSCPVTHAIAKMPLRAVPGTTGTYECWLSHNGDAIIGRYAPQLDTAELLVSTRRRRRNGHGERLRV